MHRATFDLVWLGVLILTPGVGVPAGPVCPAFPLRFRLSLSAGGRVRPVGVVPGWPGTAGTRPAPPAASGCTFRSTGRGSRPGPSCSRPPWHYPDRPDPTTRRQAQPEPKWKSRADRPSRHAHTRGQDQNAKPDKIKRCAVHPGFRYPGVYTKSKANAFGPGLDVKADGAWVVVAPSVHITGPVYRWEDDPPPLALWPEVLTERLNARPAPAADNVVPLRRSADDGRGQGYAGRA